MAENRSPRTVPVAIRQLAEMAEERGWSAPKLAGLMGRTGQWWRDIRSGQANMTVRDADHMAELGRMRLVLTTEEPWTALRRAIDALPATEEDLKANLRALMDARLTRKRPRRRASGEN